MRVFIFLFSFLLLGEFAGQAQADTLFLCGYKVALNRQKVTFKTPEHSSIHLPVEFGLISTSDKTNKKIVRNFSGFATECDETTSIIGTKIIYDSIYLTGSISSILLNPHIDTLTINKEKPLTTRPYIKSGTSKFLLSFLHFYVIKNNLYTEVTMSCMDDTGFPESFDTCFKNEPAFNGYDYILIYESAYRKKEATYLLDQQFVLKIKK